MTVTSKSQANEAARRAEPRPLSERDLFEAVFRHMRTLAGSGASDLDDLVQVAAEQVFKKLPSFEGRSDVLTWVYAVCYRVLLKQRRWYRRWSVRFRFEQEGDPVALVAEGALPSAGVERRERARVLQAALSRLSERHRAVVVLHDLEELSIAEVAVVVDCNELTARSRLRDGRKRLRALLDADPAFTWGGRHELTPS
ncbi:MAG TPA: RNA polymerase sigma factor [Polyangiaceae bacterium]